MFLKYETTAKEFVAVNPTQIAMIRDFGNDTTEIVFSDSLTRVWVKVSYLQVLGDLQSASKE